uniref:Uncharacterized protein n=1 Tax=Ciona savignyi TaxID=51511 RepID=H2Z2L4_CIOSA
MSNMAISESVFSMGAMQEKVDDIKQDINDDIFKQIDDPFKSSDPFEGSDPFAENDPFSSSATPAASSDPFAGADPFASSVGGLTPTPTSDPFNPGDFPATSSDPFKPGDFPSSTSDPFKPGDFGTDVFPQTTETPQTDPFGGQDPFATTKSSGFDTTLSSASSFAHDPFSSSEVFSGGEQPKITDSSKPTSVATTFDSGSFAAAFSDNGNTGKEDFFSNAFPTSNPTETKSTSDPWGSAFGGGAAFPAAEGDPFGGDSFTTPTQSDGFGKSTFTPDFSSMGKSKEPSKAPPRPAKPAEMSTKGVSEAEQLRWARDESRKAEEERRKLQLQEQADLELAIALSKQP